MILSFADRATEAFFEGGELPKAGWRPVAKIAARKLDQLDAAIALRELKAPPGNRLEVLSGNRKGQHSIRINGVYALSGLTLVLPKSKSSTIIRS